MALYEEQWLGILCLMSIEKKIAICKLKWGQIIFQNGRSQ